MRVLGKSCIGDRFEMFLGMIPIHNLDGMGEIPGYQVPNPSGAVPQENQVGTQVGLQATAGCPKQLAEIVRFGNITEIAQVPRPQGDWLAFGLLALTS